MKIILHCSDSLHGNAAIISKWHVLPSPDGRGWSNIGYHYIVLNGQLSSNVFNKNYDGYIETGRPLDDDNLLESFEYGAHVKGMNTKSIGICLTGERAKDWTNEQYVALVNLLQKLQKKYPNAKIVGHNELDSKNKPNCPDANPEEMNFIRRVMQS